MHTTKLPAAHSRTFSARIVDREYGVIRSISQHAVTLRKTAAGILAEVDGQAAPLREAVSLLESASRVTVTAEELVTEAAPIGKKRAHKLHKLMARLGIPEHYRFASVTLGRRVSSLAALTEQEARRVWADLCTLYPEARKAAA